MLIAVTFSLYSYINDYFLNSSSPLIVNVKNVKGCNKDNFVQKTNEFKQENLTLISEPLSNGKAFAVH